MNKLSIFLIGLLVLSAQTEVVDIGIPEYWQNSVFYGNEIAQAKLYAKDYVDDLPENPTYPLIEVPQELISNDEYAVSGYFLWEWGYPHDIPYHTYGTNDDATIFSLSTERNNCEFDKNDLTGYLLDLRFGNWADNRSYGLKFTTNNEPNRYLNKKQIRFPEQGDWDRQWLFIYMGYSKSLETVFTYVHFPYSDEIITERWNNISADVAPETPLYLKLGNCGDKIGFNGRYSNVQLHMGSGSYLRNQGMVEDLQYSYPKPPAMPSPEYKEYDIVTYEEDFHYQTVRNDLEYEVTDMDGAKEYSAWGWFRLDQQAFANGAPIPRSKYTLFNVYSHKNHLGHQYEMGDAALRMYYQYFGGNQIGRYQMYANDKKWGQQSWANLGYYKDGQRKQAQNEWAFVYQGYSIEKQKSFAYIKIGDYEETIVGEPVRQHVPYYFKITVGHYETTSYFWNGGIRGFTFAAGPGAYREGDFSDLYDRKPWDRAWREANQPKEPELVEEQPAAPAQPQNTDMGAPSNTSMGAPTNTSMGSPTTRPQDQAPSEIPDFIPSSKDIVGPQQDTVLQPATITSNDNPGFDYYGVYGWSYFSFNRPKTIENGLDAWKGQCYAIAKVQVNGGNGLTVKLCVDQSGNVTYVFCDKTETNACVNASVLNPVEEVVDQWVWYYYAHSQEPQQNVAYLYFDKNQNALFGTQEASQPEPINWLTYKLGGKQPEQRIWNGYFYKPVFFTEPQYFFGNQQDVENFRNQNASDLPEDSLVDPDALQETMFYPVTTPNAYDVDQKSSPEDSSVKIDDVQRVLDYAAFGYTKVAPQNQLGQHDWIFFFRFTINKPGDLSNATNAGDRTLAMWFNRNNQVYVVSYTVQPNQVVNPNVYAVFPTTFTMDDVTEGEFFTYMGYSADEKKVYAYVKLYNGTVHAFAIENLQHIPAYHLALYTGIDYNGVETYPALDGNYRQWHIVAGPGSYAGNEDEVQPFIDMCNQNLVPVEEEEEEVFEPIIVGGDESSWSPQEPMEIIQNLEPIEVEPQIWGPNDNEQEESYPQTLPPQQQQQPSSNDISAPAPEGECAIVYSECPYSGDFVSICDKVPDISFVVKSAYVPEGCTLKLWNLPSFEGQTAIFQESFSCNENINYNLLKKNQKKSLRGKSSETNDKQIGGALCRGDDC